MRFRARLMARQLAKAERLMCNVSSLLDGATLTVEEMVNLNSQRVTIGYTFRGLQASITSKVHQAREELTEDWATLKI